MINDVLSVSCGKWAAEICPRLGANVISLRYDAENVLVPLNDEKQLEINPYIQGMPLLFPANRTRNGKFSWQGKSYSLPVNEEKSRSNLHGFLNCCSFDTVFRDECSARLVYRHIPDGRFPFAFEFSVVYTADENGFHQEYILKNTDEVSFPFTFSVHTTFAEPEKFSVPLSKQQARDEINLPTGEWLDLTADEKEFLTGSPSKGKVISGYYSACGNVACVGEYIYRVSDNFDHWILFNGRGESSLLCVEPQCGCVDGLNIPGGHRVISPGEHISFTSSITRE